MLLISIILLVIGARSSDNLAAWHRSNRNHVTTVLAYIVVRAMEPVAQRLRYSAYSCSSWRILQRQREEDHGNWFPLLIGLLSFTLLTTQARGPANPVPTLSAIRAATGKFRRRWSLPRLTRVRAPQFS